MEIKLSIMLPNGIDASLVVAFGNLSIRIFHLMGMLESLIIIIILRFLINGTD